MKMKIALGLVVACAACCALPVLIGGSGLGLLGLARGNAAAMIIGGALLAVTGIIYWRQGRRAAAACARTPHRRRSRRERVSRLGSAGAADRWSQQG